DCRKMSLIARSWRDPFHSCATSPRLRNSSGASPGSLPLASSLSTLRTTPTPNPSYEDAPRCACRPPKSPSTPSTRALRRRPLLSASATTPTTAAATPTVCPSPCRAYLVQQPPCPQ